MRDYTQEEADRKELVAMNQAIEDASQGMSYEEMMKDPKVVVLIQKRDDFKEQIEAMAQEELDEYKKENPFFSELLA